jgi:hypothetical protein
MEGPSTSSRPDLSAQAFNRRGAGHLPGLVGLEIISVNSEAIESRGDGCVVNLPQGAHGFTTIELKTNFLGTALEGALRCRAVPVHLGRTTQVWDANVTVEGSGKGIALFRCTQMVLWPKEGAKVAKQRPA